MSKTIKYIGTQTRWPELAVTGKQNTWSPGWGDERSDSEAAALLATGLFFDVDSASIDEQKAMAVSDLVLGGGIRGKKVRSLKGPEAFDLMAISGLPAGASFSGAGTYAGANILAVQSTGTVTHNATGWYDGSPCIDFVPNTDSSAEFRIYNAAGFNISDDDGIAFEFAIPMDLDTSKVNFSIIFSYSSDAVSLFPTNTSGVDVWRCDQSGATYKEKGGRKYIRQRWDYDATDANAGAFHGYNRPANGGTGADRTALVKWVRFAMSKFSGKTVKFKAVRRGGSSMPCLVMGSDSITPEDAVLQGFSYMAQKDMGGYICTYISALTGLAGTLDRMRRAHAAGFGTPGDDIVDRPLGETVLDRPTMTAGIVGTKVAMAAYGLTRDAKIWVANNNSTSYLMIEELVAAGYVCNRNGATDGRYVFPEGGVPDPFRLPSVSLDNLSAATMQAYVDRTITYQCTLWMYWHGMLSSARLDADRTANVTGTAGAPAARSGVETIAAYRTRMVGLGAGIGAASVAYFDARIGSASLGVWYEDWKTLVDYINTKRVAGDLVVAGASEWCADVGLLT